MQRNKHAESSASVPELLEALEESILYGNFQLWDYDISTGKLYVKCKDVANSYFREDIDDAPDFFVKNSYISSESLNDYSTIFTALKKGEKSVDKNIWVHLPNTFAPICVRVYCKNSFDESGNPFMAHCFIKNITDIVNSEKNFKHRANSALRANTDAVATFSVNISKNLCNDASSGISSIQMLLNCTSYDNLVTQIVSLIKDKSEGIHFVNTFSRGALISSFEKGIFQVEYVHHMRINPDKNVWVKTIVDIFNNPLTNEIEAAIHIKNIHSEKIVEDLFDGIITQEFNFVGLAFLRTDTFVIIDKNNRSFQERRGFIDELQEYVQIRINNPDEKKRIMDMVSMQKLINMITDYGEHIIHFNTDEGSENNHHIIIRFAFLNNSREVITVTCRDITLFYNEEQEQHKMLSDALNSAEKANRAKSDFLCTVSHDIRTPLSGITGLLDLASKETDIGVIKDYISKAKESSEYMMGILNDVVDLSKIEAGRLELHPIIYSIQEFKEYVKKVIQPICDKRNIHLAVISSDTIPYIYIDKLRLNQIIYTLLMTTSKYTNFSGFLTLEIITKTLSETQCETSFIIYVHNYYKSNGLYKLINNLLNDEIRDDYSLSDGLGLSLNFARNVLYQMNGSLSVSNDSVKGTAITVTLINDFYNVIPETICSEETIKTKDYTGYKFLLCEDDVINREIATELLNGCGATVETAENGKIGLDMYLSKPEGYYAAVFMDVRMPEMDGLTASKLIRSANRMDSQTLPIIAITANAMVSDKTDCLDAGMNGYISKPIDVATLYQTIYEFI